MKRLAFSLISLAFLATPFLASASTQIFMSSNSDVRGTQSTRWLPLTGEGTLNAFATSSMGIMSVGGTFSNLQAQVDFAPGGSASWIITIDDNNHSVGSLTCTIGSGATTCSDTSDTAVTAANDVVSIKATASGGTPAGTKIRVSAQFTPTSSGHTAIPFTPLTIINSASQKYIPLSGGAGWNAPETARTGIFPEAGTLENLYSGTVTAPGSGKSALFTLRQNSATTSINCTIADTAKNCNDLSDTASIADQDLINLAETPFNTPAAINPGFGMDFVPSTAGDFDFFGYNASADNANLTVYVPVSGNLVNANEASTTLVTQVMTVTNLEFYIPTSPGGAKTRTFTLRKNGADTAIACTVSGTTGHICSGTGSVSFALGDTIDISDTPSSSTATSQASWAIVANVGGTPPPPAATPPVNDDSWVWGWLLSLFGL